VKYQLNKRHSQSILELESGTSYREIARKCHISKSSAVEYANLVASQKRSENLHRVWRKRSKGLEITTKGSKELPGGRRVNVKALEYFEAEMHVIPPRSPDLNPMNSEYVPYCEE
jgi:hypothetical protein